MTIDEKREELIEEFTNDGEANAEERINGLTDEEVNNIFTRHQGWPDCSRGFSPNPISK